jgi:hypothetical protein
LGGGMCGSDRKREGKMFSSATYIYIRLRAKHLPYFFSIRLARCAEVWQLEVWQVRNISNSLVDWPFERRSLASLASNCCRTSRDTGEASAAVWVWDGDF